MVFKTWKSRLTASIAAGTIAALLAGESAAVAKGLKGKPYSGGSGTYDYYAEPGYAPVPPAPQAPSQGARSDQGEQPPRAPSEQDGQDAQPQPSDRPSDTPSDIPDIPSVDPALDPTSDAAAADAATDSLSADTGAASAPASSAPNMIGDFLGTGGTPSYIVGPQIGLGVADAAPGVSAPFGPFGVVSYVDPLFGGYVYRNGPPVPFGDFLIIDSGLINSDSIVDFDLEPRIPSSGSSSSSSSSSHIPTEHVALSNGIVTPSLHDLYDIHEVFSVIVPDGGGAVVGRNKLSDNNSPLPRDRVFLDYSYFDNAAIGAGGVNVKRFTPGFERTGFGGLFSMEFRVPMAITLDSQFSLGGANDLQHYEFGNLFLAAKRLLYQDGRTAISAGLGATLPTADDFEIIFPNGDTLLQLQNESVHLIPYLAFLYEPNCQFYLQGFAQVDVDVNGSTVQANTMNGQGVREIGTLNDQTLLQLDLGLGYWLYRNPCACCGLSGISLTGEVHYTTNLEDSEVVQAGLVQVGRFNNDFDIVNLTFGCNILQANGTTATFGYGVPVGQDQIFDGELRVLLNRYF